jgi:hypothetical protein
MRHFAASDTLCCWRIGPWELPLLDGGAVRLSSFRQSKHVVLEFGSIT